MLRPPSVQKQYDDYYPYDPAFTQLPDNATDAQKEAHGQAWDTARETGDFRPLGDVDQATRFVRRPLSGKVVNKLDDLRAAGRVGTSEFFELVFRCSLIDVINGHVKVRQGYHEDPNLRVLGEIATADIINQLYEIDPRIVPVMGLIAWAKAVQLPGK